jgi:hypothetical protein
MFAFFFNRIRARSVRHEQGTNIEPPPPALEELLRRVAGRLPFRAIHVEGDLYLGRWYVLGRLPARYWPDVSSVLGWLPISVYLHRFFRPDRDRELHSHPWRWALSLILTGGYLEERRQGEREVVTRRRDPGTLNLIRHGDYHRVLSLPTEDVWTLFIAGPKISSWGFWDPDTGEEIPHQEFFERQRAKLAPL